MKRAHLHLRVSGTRQVFVLDNISTASTAAYSLRKLRDAYSGSAIRVRRSNDNAEEDIGFTADGNLDQVALMNHVGYQNLLTYSEEFDNAAWTNTESTTITPNSTLAPNGTLTADTMTPDAVNTNHRLSQVTTGGVTSGVPYTFSIYVKPNGYDWFFVRSAVTGTFQNANFNLSTGAVGYVSAGLTASITSATNGFYRIVVTGTTPSTSNISFFFRSAPTEQANDSVNTFTGNGTSGAFIWGAQINQGATAQTYSSTSRRNLLTFSEEFDNAAWLKVNVSATGDTVIAPNNTQTADTILSFAGTSGKYFSQYFTSISGKAYTYSMYAKQDTGRYLQITPVGGGVFPITAQTFVNFDLQTGTVSSAGTDFVPADYSITDEGNGWYRISLTATATSSSAVARFLILSLDTGLETRLPSISSTPSYGVFGGQVEEGLEPTEYQRVNASWIATRDGNGFVTTLYDQSGNARNATQATAGNQPQIVTGGVVNTENGKPSLKLDGTNSFMDISAPIAFGGVSVVLNALDGATFGNYDGIFGGQATAYWATYAATTTIMAMNASGTPWINGISTNDFSPLSDLKVVTTNNIVTSAEATGWRIGQDRNVTTRRWNGNMSEIVAFPSLLSTTDRQTLERNQGQYYAITVA